jgi:hypothetical protein
MRRWVVRLLALGLFVLLPGVTNPGAAAAGVRAATPAGLTAAFSTDSVAVGVGAGRVVMLQVANGTPAPVTGVEIALTTDPGIEAQAAGPPAVLGVGEAAAIKVTITRSSIVPPAGSVFAVVTYRTGADPGGGQNTVVAIVKVTDEPRSAAPAAPVTITASVGRDALVQYQSTEVFFTIANTSGHVQKITTGTVSYPDFLTVSLLGAAGNGGASGSLALEEPVDLGAGDSKVLHLHLAAQSALQPGSGIVLLSVRAVDQTNKTGVTVTASQTLTFTVLGESGVLTVLGVPSLLFVPGLVFALVLWALWTYVWPRKPGAKAHPGMDTEGKITLWVFALLPTLSLPFLYPVVTGWFAEGHGRDYRRSYGLDDILYVWLMAAAMALVIWALCVVARTAWKALFVPQEGQRELRLLSVFALRQWDRSLSRDIYTYQGQNVAELGRIGQQTLVSPQILYDRDRLSPAEVKKIEEGTGYVPDKPFRAWWFLWQTQHRTRPGYDDMDGIKRPTLVDTSKLSSWIRADSLVATRPPPT